MAGTFSLSEPTIEPPIPHAEEDKGEVATSNFLPVLGVGDPENAGVTPQSRPLLGPQEGRVR